MIDRCRILIAVVGLAGSPSLALAAAQSPDPNSPRYKGVVALSDLLTGEGDDALDRFVDDRVAPTLRNSLGRDGLTKALDELRSGFSSARMSGASPEGPFGALINFSNGESISFELESDPPHRFLRIASLGKGTPRENGVTSLKQLHEQLRAEAAAETFSGAVLIAKDGEPIFDEAYGYADRKAGRLNRTDTKFNIGSINKIFTMVAVYQLLDGGKIAPEDTIGRYLPQFPAGVANKVTVQHLLGHRSGWGAYWENPTFLDRRTELRSLDDYMAFIKNIPLDFEPGSSRQYSNTGYQVLGAIIEKASGQSYFDYVRDHVYKPAGMTNTDAYEHGGSTPNMAIGYTGGGYDQDNSSIIAVRGTAAGGGLSTTTDLLRFANALDEGVLLPKKYAGRLRGGAFAGGGPGVSAVTHMRVAGDYRVIVLSNFDMPGASDVARRINQMLRGNPVADTGGKRYRIGVGLTPHEDGIAVSFLEPDSPGEKGGLKPDDVILAINGTSIADDPIGHFDAVLTKPDRIKLKVRRGSSLQFVTITPEAIAAASAHAGSSGAEPCKPGCASPVGEAGAESNSERLLGVLTDAPDATTAEAMGLTRRIRTEGRIITGMRSGSPADRAGLVTGDVLLQLGNNRLYSRDGLIDFLKTAKPGTFPIRFKRGGTKTERTAQVSLSSNDLPKPGAGIRWQYSGMGQLDEALAAARDQGKRLLVGLSGSETCCGFSRFEVPSVAAALAGDNIVRLAGRYVTLIIRRPHAYWFLQQVSDTDENAPILAIPSGLKLPGGDVLPIPSVFILDPNRDVIDHIALADRSSSDGLAKILRKLLPVP